MMCFECALAARSARHSCAASSRCRSPFGCLLWLLWLMFSHFSAAAGPGPAVRDVVEWTRIIQPANHDVDLLRSQISPDGTHAFIVTRKADVATDRNVFEILLLDVTPEHLETGRSMPVRKLLSVDATLDLDYAQPFLRDVQWIGDRTLVFRASLHDAPMQVYALDIESGQVTTLTSETRPIVWFSVADDLRRVVYLAQVPNPPMAAGAHSVVVGHQSFWSVKFGQNDLRQQDRRFQYMVLEPGRNARPLGADFPASSGYEQGVSISPDGRWVLLPHYVPERQAEWVGRYPLLEDVVKLVGSSRDADPLGYYSHPSSFTVWTTTALRLADGHEQTVIDAPDDAIPGLARADRLWFEGGRSVIVAGTHLPFEPGVQTSTRSHIIEYHPDSGSWTVIAELQDRLGAAYRVAGRRDAFVALDGDRHRYFARMDNGRWAELPEGVDPSRVDRSDGTAALASWTLRVKEELNQPPDIFAFGPEGKTTRLTDLNPQFSAKTWGLMRPYSWKDGKGRDWDGGLMTPNGSEGGGPRALVIQSYGFSPRRFYLDGANIGDGFTSGFAGRAFLRDDILVLALPIRPTTHRLAPNDFRGALDAYQDEVRGAIDALVTQGLVDPARIGLMGWSATGERVLNFVTFSDTPIRAATLLDGDANTLFSLPVTYGSNDSIWSRKERTNEGLPYGSRLDRWIRYDPSLHTDCVKAAVRIETYGPVVLNNWDIYALLRRQYKPVEMVVIPGGSHALSRPSERMISLQGNVDWYDFWLQGHERDEPVLVGEDAKGLAAQYSRWRQMKALKKADDARPRCSLQRGG